MNLIAKVGGTYLALEEAKALLTVMFEARALDAITGTLQTIESSTYRMDVNKDIELTATYKSNTDFFAFTFHYDGNHKRTGSFTLFSKDSDHCEQLEKLIAKLEEMQ